MSDPIERDLAALNEFAREQLGRQPWDPEPGGDGQPAPDDLPPYGAWIAARRRVDGELVGVYHQFVGWNSSTGNLGVMCNRFRPGRAITAAYAGWARWGPRADLDVVANAPDDACQRCLDMIDRRERVVIPLGEQVRNILEDDGLTDVSRLEAIRRLVGVPA